MKLYFLTRECKISCGVLGFLAWPLAPSHLKPNTIFGFLSSLAMFILAPFGAHPHAEGTSLHDVLHIFTQDFYLFLVVAQKIEGISTSFLRSIFGDSSTLWIYLIFHALTDCRFFVLLSFWVSISIVSVCQFRYWRLEIHWLSGWWFNLLL